MPPVKGLLCDIAVLTALMLCTLSTSPACAQTAAASLVDQLIGPETDSDIDVPALRQQAAERIKSRADLAPLKRPPIAPRLLKLPQFSFDVVFDPDSSVVRPESYRTMGRIADALYNPKLLPFAFLIVGHTDGNGRRDANLALSQRRADSIREVLVNTFKLSAKRIQTVGLGEEQLLDSARPTAAVNLQAQIMTIGKRPVTTDVPPPPKPATKPAKPAKKR